jgi:hypothetical protein
MLVFASRVIPVFGPREIHDHIFCLLHHSELYDSIHHTWRESAILFYTCRCKDKQEGACVRSQRYSLCVCFLKYQDRHASFVRLEMKKKNVVNIRAT